MTATRIDLLRRMAVFGGINEASLEIILEQSKDQAYQAGDYFFREGDRAESLFVLEQGQVTIERTFEEQQVQLANLGPGDCFGEMSLIDFQPRSASVRADCLCESIEIPASTLRSLHRHDLEQYAMIMMNLGREVSRRLRLADQRLFALRQIHPNDPSMAV